MTPQQTKQFNQLQKQIEEMKKEADLLRDTVGNLTAANAELGFQASDHNHKKWALKDLCEMVLNTLAKGPVTEPTRVGLMSMIACTLSEYEMLAEMKL
jgi:hypothetical protein